MIKEEKKKAKKREVKRKYYNTSYNMKNEDNNYSIFLLLFIAVHKTYRTTTNY